MKYFKINLLFYNFYLNNNYVKKISIELNILIIIKFLTIKYNLKNQMIVKLNMIILYSLVAFFISFALYPLYIELLKKLKAWKTLRENDTTGDKASIFNQLHNHKAGTPTMWGWIFLIVVWILVLSSYIIQYFWYTNNSLITREETYILLFWFFSMWILWLIDDFLNINWVWKMKWLTAKMKLLWMFLFSWFISFFFYFRIWIDYINFWPFWWEISLWIFYLPLTFFLTLVIVNAINITDWLDWLAWWLLLLVLMVLMLITFFYKWYLATTLIWILMWTLLAFLWFNINPAKIFMWDSGSLWIWWLIASLLFLINIKMWILFPFLVLFYIFLLEFSSSFLQILSKKLLKKKLFPIAPYHHLLEFQGRPEHNIVMKFWLFQWVLCALTFVLIFYQLNL